MSQIYNSNLYYRLLIIIGILVFLLLFYLKGGAINLSLFATIFSAAGITLLIDLILLKLLMWRYVPNWFYICKITKIPFLGGEWEGVYESDFIHPDTNDKVLPDKVKIKIIHNFDNISVILLTDKSHSTSYIAGVTIDHSGQKYLNYMYSSVADKNREINPRHDGATRLRISIENDIKLEGHYWTDRKTLGALRFVRKNTRNPKI